MRLKSATDRFFLIFLLATLALGVFAHFAEAQDFWAPVMETLAYFVVASIFVNVVRLWWAFLIQRK